MTTQEFAEALIVDLDALFPGKSMLAVDEVCQFLGCQPEVVYNWNKRSNPKRRPPSLTIGKQLRFQKRLFARWLAQEHEMKGSQKGDNF